MEETVTVFDWNFVYGIVLGLIFGFITAWIWFRRSSKGFKSSVGKSNWGKKKEIKVKKHGKDELPDSDWDGATFKDTDAELHTESEETVKG